jgi:hypothetical protein
MVLNLKDGNLGKTSKSDNAKPKVKNVRNKEK